MKISIFLTLVLILPLNNFLIAQKKQAKTEINPENYAVYNRDVSYKDGIAHLNAKVGDGILWLNDPNFKNGTIELDLKGRNAPGQSFVGVAFHGKDNQTFDAVYFRPFNFQNAERNGNSIQYISMPENDWSALRSAFPGKYENAIDPVPEPVDEWFHAKIVVNYPQVQVYINGSGEPTLEAEQISDRKQGKVGFWVGNGSEGWFRNLEITAAK